MQNTQTEQTNETSTVLRVTWISLAANIALCALKFTAGFLGRSQAVIADAVHSLSDTASDLAIILGARFWNQPPDKNHPYGHRRIETMVTLIIGFMLAIAGIGLAWNAIISIHLSSSKSPGWIAFWAAIISIIIKEIMYRWTLRASKQTGSIALEANAWHHRTDALSSIPAALAVAGAVLLPSWTLLDRIGAIVVSVMILYAAFKITRPRIAEVLESGASEEVKKEIEQIAKSVEGVTSIHKIRTRYVGANLHIDLHVQVNSSMPIKEAHDISMAVTKKLLQELPNVFDVVVHIEPSH